MEPVIIILILLIVIFIIEISCFFCYNGHRSYFDNLYEKYIHPVDIVYTWVNSRDPEWIKQYTQYKNAEYVIDQERLTTSETPWEDLELSIRATRKYLPWVRNIIVVTMRPQKCQKVFQKNLE